MAGGLGECKIHPESYQRKTRQEILKSHGRFTA